MYWHRGLTLFQDPDDFESCKLTYTQWLNSGETLADATVTVESGLTLEVTDIQDSGTSVQLFLSGGTAGSRYKVSVKVTTDSSPARINEKSFYLQVAEQ